MAEQTLNIPQLLVFLAVTVLVLRWWFKPAGASTPTSAANRRPNPAQIDQLAQMFPQLDRRTIAWNLQRNGGNVQGVTETVLGGRSLEQVRSLTSLAKPAACIPTGVILSLICP
jgi:coupling of ubiquitin conjugation to ER degradation protein 1